MSAPCVREESGGPGMGVRWIRLDGTAELAQQRADGWAEDDQASDSDDGDERDDQTVLDQALRPVLLKQIHVEAPEGGGARLLSSDHGPTMSIGIAASDH